MLNVALAGAVSARPKQSNPPRRSRRHNRTNVTRSDALQHAFDATSAFDPRWASSSPHVHKHWSTRSLNESPWSPATKRATDPSNTLASVGRASRVRSPRNQNFVSHRHHTNCWTCSMSKRNKPASRPGFHSCFFLGDKPETFSLVLILGIKEKLVLSTKQAE